MASLARSLLASALSNRDALMTFYSKELLMSVGARREGSSPICVRWTLRACELRVRHSPDPQFVRS